MFVSCRVVAVPTLHFCAVASGIRRRPVRRAADASCFNQSAYHKNGTAHLDAGDLLEDVVQVLGRGVLAADRQKLPSRKMYEPLPTLMLATCSKKLSRFLSGLSCCGVTAMTPSPYPAGGGAPPPPCNVSHQFSRRFHGKCLSPTRSEKRGCGNLLSRPLRAAAEACPP